MLATCLRRWRNGDDDDDDDDFVDADAAALVLAEAILKITRL